MSEYGDAVEMSDGSLRFDPGLPAPETVPEGYVRDPSDFRRFRLEVRPVNCPNRESRLCVHGGKRSYCRRRQVYVNPGACCRCQGLLAPLS